MNAEFWALRHRQTKAFHKMKTPRVAIQAAAAFGYPYGKLNAKYRKWEQRYNALSREVARRLGVPVNRVKFIDNFNRSNW